MTDILDLIDAAVSDWTVSGDAMRHDPEPAPVAPAWPYFALTETQARIFAALADDLGMAMRDLGEVMAANAESMRKFAATWQAGIGPQQTVQGDRWTGRQHRRRRR